MALYRFIVALILVVVVTLASSCSYAIAATKSATTYTPAQIEQIQVYVPRIQALRERMEELQTLIQKQEWVDVGTFIHGPLGTLRQNLNRVAFKLNPQDKAAASQTAKDLYNDLVRIDQAAQEGKYQQAVSNYRSALQELDAFLKLIPKI